MGMLSGGGAGDAVARSMNAMVSLSKDTADLQSILSAIEHGAKFGPDDLYSERDHVATVFGNAMTSSLYLSIRGKSTPT
jgi:hypothetical protein